MSWALWKRYGKQLVAFELVALGGAYCVWTDLNNSAEARKRWSERSPWLMEAFDTATGGRVTAVDGVVAGRSESAGSAGQDGGVGGSEKLVGQLTPWEREQLRRRQLAKVAETPT